MASLEGAYGGPPPAVVWPDPIQKIFPQGSTRILLWPSYYFNMIIIIPLLMNTNFYRVNNKRWTRILLSWWWWYVSYIEFWLTEWRLVGGCFMIKFRLNGLGMVWLNAERWKTFGIWCIGGICDNIRILIININNKNSKKQQTFFLIDWLILKNIFNITLKLQ